jgi:hypothetical protein
VSGTIHKELRPLIKEAIAQGFTLKVTRKNHLLLKRGSASVTASGTPSNPTTARKMLAADLRRAGANV